MVEHVLRKIKKRLFPGPVDISDEYINRLFCANAGMLLRGNLYAFDYAIKNLPSDAPVVEIGSYCGLSTNVLTYYLEKYNKPNALFTCDTWEYMGEKDHLNPGAPYLQMVGEHPSLTREDYMQFVKNSFKQNILMFSSRRLPFSYECTSSSFFSAWEHKAKSADLFGRMEQMGGPISFCFVDGDHRYEYARNDWENLDKYLESGGFVLLDDSGDHISGSRNQLARELKNHSGYEYVLKNPNYLFRKK
ncbi:MAG: class I SAM-dependent methyltransferase [Bacteroidia bacterium]